MRNYSHTITVTIATLDDRGNPSNVNLSRLAAQLGYSVPQSDEDVWELYGAACDGFPRQDWFVLSDKVD